MHSLEEFLSFTFTENMVSARHKDKLTWIQTTKYLLTTPLLLFQRFLSPLAHHLLLER